MEDPSVFRIKKALFDCSNKAFNFRFAEYKAIKKGYQVKDLHCLKSYEFCVYGMFLLVHHCQK